MTIIRVSRLVKTYPGRIEALRGVDFSIRRGEIFGLLGPNGAGKSTTVRILTTLAEPTSGGAEVAGFNVATEPEEVRRRIGYVSQGSAVDLQATPRENLALQGRLYGIRRRAIEERVNELLELFELDSVANRLARTLSGGMQRRLDLAMGLVHRPEVLFLDEPTTGLDPESRAVLWREVERQAREEALTILLTTHYLEEADRLADRVAIIDEGMIVAEGTTDELKGMLRGDRISVELQSRGELDEARMILQGVDGVVSVTIEGRILHTQVPEGGRMVPVVLQALDRAGLAVSQVSVSRPSLDDVYLNLTGKSFARSGSAELEAGQGTEVVAA